MKGVLVKFLVVACAVALVGCGGSGTPAQAPESTAKPAETAAASAPKVEAISVNVGSTEQAALKNLPMFMAGFGEAAGVNVQYKEYKGGSEVAKGLLNGEVDMAFMAVDHVLKDKSGEFRMLAMVTNGPGQALVVDSQFKDSIKSVKDLAGQKVGVSSLGSGPHSTLNALLAANNIDPKTVQVLPVGLDVQQVLGTGKVAAVVTIEPYITIAEQSGKGVVLVDARQAKGIQAIYGTPEVPWIALVTRTGFLKDNPKAAERMVSMVSKSLSFIASSPASSIAEKSPAFFKAAVKDDNSLFTKMLDQNKATFSKDGRFNQAALEEQWKKLQASGAVSKETPLPFAQLVDTAFLDKVK